VIDGLGALCWHELVTADVDRAKSYFARLYAMTYHGLPAGSGKGP
jgi:predicted enzyme related to lactoylglutathione lyase